MEIKVQLFRAILVEEFCGPKKLIQNKKDLKPFIFYCSISVEEKEMSQNYRFSNMI